MWGAWGCRELELLLINNVVKLLLEATLERDLLIQWIQRSCFWGLLLPQLLIISHLLRGDIVTLLEYGSHLVSLSQWDPQDLWLGGRGSLRTSSPAAIATHLKDIG